MSAKYKSFYLIFSSFSDVATKVKLIIVELRIVQDVRELLHVAVDDVVHRVGKVVVFGHLLVLGLSLFPQPSPLLPGILLWYLLDPVWHQSRHRHPAPRAPPGLLPAGQ